MTTFQFLALCAAVFLVLYFGILYFATEKEIELASPEDAQGFASQWNRDPHKATHLSVIRGEPSTETYDDEQPFNLDQSGIWEAIRDPKGAA